MDTGFKRIHALPKRWFRHTVRFDETPRGRYIRIASERRYYKRMDSVDPSGLINGEVGSIGSFRFIDSEK